jgi:hypothetical protein
MKYLVLKEQKRNFKLLKETDSLNKAVHYMLTKTGMSDTLIAKVITEWEIMEK